MLNNLNGCGCGRGRPRGSKWRSGPPRNSIPEPPAPVPQTMSPPVPLTAPPPDFMAANDLAVSEPITRADEKFDVEALSLQRVERVRNKRAIQTTPRQDGDSKRRQLQRIMLPNSPPRQRTRKQSPQRVAVRVAEGVPPAPPPARQPQELRQNRTDREEASPAAVPAGADGMPASTIGDNCVVVELIETGDNWSFSYLHDDTDLPTESGDEASLNIEEEHPEMNDDDLIDKDDKEEQDEMASEVPMQPTDFTHLDMQLELLDTEEVQWLAHQDVASDNLVHGLLTSDGAADGIVTFDWTCDPTAFRGTREMFTGTPGPTFPVTTSTKPSDVFLRFFDDDLLDLLVRETNSYAMTIIRKTSMAPKSRLKAWRDTDRAEMGVFLSVLMFQGLLPRPNEKDYWCENGYLTLTYFKQLMSYSRFLLIKRMLHFADNGDIRRVTNYDDRKLRQIWPVLNLLNKKFSALYRPGRDVAVDESLLKWQGQLGFAQKIATKAAKVGIKSYELCESETGYLWKFFVYTGQTELDRQTERDVCADRQTNGQTDEQAASSAPPPPPDAIARIVYDLANPLLNLGHTIVMDNFYNSPLLARYLKSHGTDCFGTLRINREFVPEDVKIRAKSEMRVGEIVQSFCRDLHVMMWRDTDVVAMISTFHKGEVGGKEKHGRHRYKPQMVLDYNLSMGGVEKKDQLLSPYPIERVRNLVWYKKVFRRLLNVTILNSYIIYRTANKITHRMFRTRLAEELVQTFRPPPVERPITTVKTKSMMAGHGTVRRPIVDGNHFVGEGRSRYSRCIHCHQSRTRYVCKQCNVSLCLLTCFELFHTNRADN